MKPMFEQRSRHTIMDGQVVEFATAFEEKPGIVGPIFEAKGSFEVSASRNAVVVHRADLRSDEALEQFVEAVRAAQKEAHRLTREGWGGNYRIIASDNG